MNPVELNLFASRIAAVCDEMGSVLKRTAFSPNIKDRLDFSCAVFDSAGALCAQAAHIPVHLGSMAFAMAGIVGSRQWQDGDVLILNDPYLGGTHLPDVTVVTPVYTRTGTTDEPSTGIQGFVVNRAHHANIGCDTPGSMPVSASLEEEGLIIPPTLLRRNGEWQPDALQLLGFTPSGPDGDFAAQCSANSVGAERLRRLIAGIGTPAYRQGLQALNHYADRLARHGLRILRPGTYRFADCLDDDGRGHNDIRIHVTATVSCTGINLDFTGSDDQVEGNLNCPRSVTAAAAYYCLRCLMPATVPACAGAFKRIHIITRPGSLVDARRPAAVAAGNVETSTRLVDVIFGALAAALPEVIPAASQGSMNNIAMGYIDSATGERWDYYETLGGGMGGGPRQTGLHGVHSHMTNTLNTPVESLETHYPLRVRRYALRRDSGGTGLHPGGEGVEREFEFLSATRVSLLTERRRHRPWGLAGGGDGAPGVNLLNGKMLPGKCSFTVKAGDRLLIESPGGGGWGSPPG
ncbi:MAG: hydantoinase B/oxoprolinase family protein [Pseudohongiellaceae bacterium]